MYFVGIRYSGGIVALKSRNTWSVWCLCAHGGRGGEVTPEHIVLQYATINLTVPETAYGCSSVR